MGSGVEGSPFSLPSNKKDRDEQGSNANLRLLLIGEVAALTVALPTAASAQASHDSVALGSNASVSPGGPVDRRFPECEPQAVRVSLRARIISWGHKCLAVGQFCKVGNREYRRYGFYCPASGHLRRR
jgi:hypothetical protein